MCTVVVFKTDIFSSTLKKRSSLCEATLALHVVLNSEVVVLAQGC
jgi:hypothetical protein